MSRHKNIWGMSVCSIFFVEQNIKTSEHQSYVNHPPYFTHELENPIIENHRKILRQPVAN